MKKQIFLTGIIEFTLLVIGGMVAITEGKIDPLQLHKDALVVDMHSDTVLRMIKGFDFGIRDTSGHMDIPRLQEGGIDLQVFACWLDTRTAKEECRQKVDLMLDSLDYQINRYHDKISICLTADDAVRIINDGKIAAFLAIENGVAIACDLSNLDHFYRRGVRYMTLTHTESSDWCISSADKKPAFNGLTDFGRDVVRKMNELGMIVDISHAAPSAVSEVLKISGDPIIASHSCVHNHCPHDRNLTDNQIKAISARGGIIGINFYNAYLSARWNAISDSVIAAHKEEMDSIAAQFGDDMTGMHEAMRPIFREMKPLLKELMIDVDLVVDHIDYIVNLVGPDYVGLGSDFDGVHALPKNLADCSMVPNITKELVNRGYSEEDIKKILGGNFMRVFKQVCDN